MWWLYLVIHTWSMLLTMPSGYGYPSKAACEKHKPIAIAETMSRPPFALSQDKEVEGHCVELDSLSPLFDLI